MSVIVSRHRTVMMRIALLQTNPHEIIFMQETDEDHTYPETFKITPELWRDMGEPDVITISVEPGDMLNVGT